MKYRPDSRFSADREQNARDLQAVSDVLRGNTGAFAEIVDRYQPVVRRLALSYMRDPQDAEDVAQEIFIRVYENLGSFDLSRRFFPWMYTVAVNNVRTLKSRRTVRRERELSIDLQSDEGRTLTDGAELTGGGSYQGPEDATLESSGRVAVRETVQRLPKKLREAVILYYLEELSVAEVSEALAISEENVKSRLHRARKKLRSSLEKAQP